MLLWVSSSENERGMPTRESDAAVSHLNVLWGQFHQVWDAAHRKVLPVTWYPSSGGRCSTAKGPARTHPSPGGRCITPKGRSCQDPSIISMGELKYWLENNSKPVCSQCKLLRQDALWLHSMRSHLNLGQDMVLQPHRLSSSNPGYDGTLQPHCQTLVTDGKSLSWYLWNDPC